MLKWLRMLISASRCEAVKDQKLDRKVNLGFGRSDAAFAAMHKALSGLNEELKEHAGTKQANHRGH